MSTPSQKRERYRTDPVYRERERERARERRKDPAYRAKERARKQTPAYREQHRAYLRARREQHRAYLRARRAGVGGLHDYLARRTKDLQAQRERVLAELEDNRKEQEWLLTIS